DPVPQGVVVTAGALGGWQIEGGLSAAGSFLAWLARVSGLDVDALVAAARASPPGARGVTATAWLGGARAPWWRDSARGAFVGIDFDHGAGDLARAAIEAVAYDTARCLEAVGSDTNGSAPVALAAGGAVSRLGLWVEVLAGVTGLPVIRRRSGEAASCGAAELAARGTGLQFDRDRADPVVSEHEPDPSLVARYGDLRRRVDRAAQGIIALTDDDPDGGECVGPDEGPDRRDEGGLAS
ncbi:MAG TPA: FGGY-family carbohydrate kinase, partial [Acidimicrobiales bacterium]|nr:FGGY-family carbohydrate kinase [Acidimicrobiales bacterium]